ncbi:hypothetical protein ACN27B_12205 [Micromonospora sp. WMMD754]|uniref:hypothetical protein n=1 Tax=Micromonospora sp. WMMD754 TaxID=3404114 RepID=UPI003BF55EC4
MKMKLENGSPHVLIIDDEVERERSVADGLETQGLEIEVKSPDSVTEDDLRDADVICVDQYYDWAKVPHPDEAIYWPQDGLAIAAVVAGHLRRIDHHAAIALRTGDLARLAKNLPTSMREPLVAAQNNIDWILSKGDPMMAQKIRQLGAAVKGLAPLAIDPRSWNEGGRWLGLRDEIRWAEAALADVQISRPPENVVATYTSGTAWLRWFTHRILPFPTFLLPVEWAAAVLRLTAKDFWEISSSDSPLGRKLQECRYVGHLGSLVGERWWRAGLDAVVDDCLSEAPASSDEAEALAEQFTRLHGRTVRTLNYANPVVAVDADYRVTGVADASSCLRLAPDLWPVFAEEPWAELEEIEHDSELRTMVARGDRGRIEGGLVDYL